MPIGLATSLPAISGAEPWTGSYKACFFPKDAYGSIPRLPEIVAAMSLRISPNIF